MSIHPISHMPYGSLCAYMTTSTKLEVHNVLHCRQRRTEPRPRVKSAENVVKFGHVVFETCERTDIDKQTYWDAHRNTSHPYQCQSKNPCSGSVWTPI